MQTRIGKWANSLAVRIPNAYAKNLGLEGGRDLNVTIVDGGLLLRPCRTPCTLEELVKAITPENVHEETSWGQIAGSESW